MSAISQAVAWWCFVPDKLSPEHFVRAAVNAGYAALDLVPLKRMEHGNIARISPNCFLV